MFRTQIISGFPGVGKSHLYKNNPNLIILDSDSSNFSWLSKGVRNPDFPNNYMNHIKMKIGSANVILVSSHKIVRNALKENNISYTLVYPDKMLKNEYIKRYTDRGNDENFIKMIEENWDSFIDEIESETYPTKIKLQRGQYLKDVFVKQPDIVMCSGICTSQLDDYCGMYAEGESCYACDSVWKDAHKENELHNK